MLEVSSDYTRVTVNSGNLTPDASDLSTSDGLWCSVNVCNLLSQVELSVIFVADTLDLDQRALWLGDRLRSLV